MSISAATMEDRIGANPSWYHTIDLPDGASTPGLVDWRAYPDRLLPARLDGVRAIDVGTFDGFWAFAMERRGAEVVAIDLPSLEVTSFPPVHRERLLSDSVRFGTELGRGFAIASDLLGSSVTRVPCDVLELTPEVIGGRVGFAFLGTLLLHLRDPVGALERIRGALEPGGTLVMLEAVSLRQTVRNPRTAVARFDTAYNDMNWWLPNLRTLHQWLWAAGFTGNRRIGWAMRPPSSPDMRGWYWALTARAPAQHP